MFITPQGETLVVAERGVFRFDGKTLDEREGPKLFGFRLPGRQGAPAFERLGPQGDLKLDNSFAAAMDPQTGDLVIFSDGALIWLRRDQGGAYRIAKQRALEDVAGPVTLACSSELVVMAQSDGRVLLLGLPELKDRTVYRPVGKSEPYRVVASPDGETFAVLFHNRMATLIGGGTQPPRPLGGDVSAVAFDGNGNLLVVDRGTRVTTYEAGSLQPKDTREPPQGMLEMVYRVGVQPLYTIFPKPGELSNVVNYVLTDSETRTMGPPREFATATADLRQARVDLDIQGPIWSSLAFVVVMLSLTCVYIWRLDI